MWGILKNLLGPEICQIFFDYSYMIVDGLLIVGLLIPIFSNQLGISSMLYYVLQCLIASATGYFLGAPIIIGLIKCAMPKINDIAVGCIGLGVVIACVTCLPPPSRKKDMHFIDAILGKVCVLCMGIIFTIGLSGIGLYVIKSHHLIKTQDRIFYAAEKVLSENEIESLKKILHEATKSKITSTEYRNTLERTVFFNLLVYADRFVNKAIKVYNSKKSTYGLKEVMEYLKSGSDMVVQNIHKLSSPKSDKSDKAHE